MDATGLHQGLQYWRSGRDRGQFGDGDQFGVSLTLSDDGRTLAVGAITEDSASPGIDGDQKNNSAASAGAYTCSLSQATPGRNRPTSRPVIPTRRPVRLQRFSECGRQHTCRGQLRRRRIVSRNQWSARQHAARCRSCVYVHTLRADVDAASLHSRLECRRRRLVRGQRRSERRWEYAAGEFAG